MDVEIILPKGSLTEYEEGEDISNGLRYLTKILFKKKGEIPSFGLGGESGYGIDFENSVFKMHPFCWCEKEDCPWCSGCDCPESSFHYYVDNAEVSSSQWLQFYTDREPKIHNPNWEAIVNELNSHRSTKHSPVCDFCLKEDSLVGRLPGKSAPNFWHMKSGFRVNWYKYIERGMEVHNPNNIEFYDILKDCLQSINEVSN